jgi:hypothetical protein
MTPHDAHTPQDARTPAPTPDGTAQGLSRAQTGGLGDALRAVMSQIEFYDMHGPYLELCAQAERLERERDEALAQVERVRAALDRMDRDGYIEEGDDGVLRGHTLHQFTRSIRWAIDSEAGR